MVEITREIEIVRQTKINGDVAPVGKRYVLAENVARLLVNTKKAIFVETKAAVNSEAGIPEAKPVVNREAEIAINTRKRGEKKR